jgi:signal transduction histidine kinase
MRLMFEAFTAALASSSNPPAIYFESLDITRFEQKPYLDDFRGWLSRKYKDTRIDLIVPVSEDALGFLADVHDEPWSSAHVLFLEAVSVRPDILKAVPRAGGVLLEDHMFDVLNVIRAVLPETKYVALVYGATALEATRWRDYSEKVVAVGLEPIEIIGLSIEETPRALARLPPQSVLILLNPAVDAEGRVPGPSQPCAVISAAAKVPTFIPGTQDFGCGAVGGLGRDWSVVGRLLGEEALKRLKKPSSDVVTIPVANYTTLVFDDRQLQRWRIPEARLPAGAIVRFREPNLWRDRRGLVLTTLGVTLLQSLLIAGLVFEHRRRRRAEIDSRRNLAAIAHLDRRAAMGELATSLAHELNQPLNAILQNAGVAQMLLTSNAVPPALGEMSDIISDIRKDDIRASEVIRRMRGLLQKHELESHPVDLNDVAQETIAIVRPDARSREIELEMDLAEGVGPILGDRVHLQQVLLNLLMNAMDAVASMPPERRRVRVWTRQSDGEVRLAVRDAGTGIPAERITEIFEPFYTTKSEGSGMGMGLAIARNILEAHNGRIEAENNTSAGATVWFSVPVSPARQS